VGYIVDGTPRQVIAEDALGKRVLDSGATIKTDSLERHGSTLTWLKGGVARSATLH
jgi:hypothetical protein